MSPFLGTRGAGSNRAFGYAGAAAPAQVTGLTATDFGTSRAYNDGRIDLSWTAPANNGATISGYLIQRSTDGSTYSTLVANTGSATTTYSDTGLSSAQIYYYKVSAINAAGTGLASTAANATATTVPQAPTIGTATVPSVSQAVDVAYTANANGGKAVSVYTATSSPGSITGTGASPIRVSGLTNGTAYTFTVTATNANGTSAASAASNSVTPVLPARFMVVSGLNINPNSAYSTDGITWTTSYTGTSMQGDILKAKDYFYARPGTVATSPFWYYTTDGSSFSTITSNAVNANAWTDQTNPAHAFSNYVFAGFRVSTTPYYCYLYTSSTGTGQFTENVITGITSSQGGFIATNSSTNSNGTELVIMVTKSGTFWKTTTSPTSGWTSYSGFPRTQYGPYGITYSNGYYITWGDDGFSYSSNGTTWTASTGNQNGFTAPRYTGGNWVGGGSSGVVWYSSNLSNWSSNTPVAKDLEIAVSPSLVVALQRQDFGGTTYYTSTNGTGSWTSRTFPFNLYATAITYG